jgi:hypothetical protein
MSFPVIVTNPDGYQWQAGNAGSPRRARKAARKLMQRPFWLAGADRAVMFDHLEAAAGARRYYALSAFKPNRGLARHAEQLAVARALRVECAANGFHLPGAESVNLLDAMRACGLR